MTFRTMLRFVWFSVCTYTAYRVKAESIKTANDILSGDNLNSDSLIEELVQRNAMTLVHAVKREENNERGDVEVDPFSFLQVGKSHSDDRIHDRDGMEWVYDESEQQDGNGVDGGISTNYYHELMETIQGRRLLSRIIDKVKIPTDPRKILTDVLPSLLLETDQARKTAEQNKRIENLFNSDEINKAYTKASDENRKLQEQASHYAKDIYGRQRKEQYAKQREAIRRNYEHQEQLRYEDQEQRHDDYAERRRRDTPAITFTQTGLVVHHVEGVEDDMDNVYDEFFPTVPTSLMETKVSETSRDNMVSESSKKVGVSENSNPETKASASAKVGKFEKVASTSENSKLEKEETKAGSKLDQKEGTVPESSELEKKRTRYYKESETSETKDTEPTTKQSEKKGSVSSKISTKNESHDIQVAANPAEAMRNAVPAEAPNNGMLNGAAGVSNASGNSDGASAPGASVGEANSDSEPSRNPVVAKVVNSDGTQGEPPQESPWEPDQTPKNTDPGIAGTTSHSTSAMEKTSPTQHATSSGLGKTSSKHESANGAVASLIWISGDPIIARPSAQSISDSDVVGPSRHSDDAIAHSSLSKDGARNRIPAVTLPQHSTSQYSAAVGGKEDPSSVLQLGEHAPNHGSMQREDDGWFKKLIDHEDRVGQLGMDEAMMSLQTSPSEREELGALRHRGENVLNGEKHIENLVLPNDRLNSKQSAVETFVRTDNGLVQAVGAHELSDLQKKLGANVVRTDVMRAVNAEQVPSINAVSGPASAITGGGGERTASSVQNDGWVNPALQTFSKSMREIKARASDSIKAFKKAEKSSNRAFHELSKMGVDSVGKPITIDGMLDDMKRRMLEQESELEIQIQKSGVASQEVLKQALPETLGGDDPHTVQKLRETMSLMKMTHPDGSQTEEDDTVITTPDLAPGYEEEAFTNMQKNAELSGTYARTKRALDDAATLISGMRGRLALSGGTNNRGTNI